jgi:septal ring factor EnvC (AmiA/AmiB activator)
MQEPPTPPRRPPEVTVDPESEPATVGELRSLRRWLLVTGVWAVAATAIAVIALVKANEEDTSVQERTAGQIARVQRNLNDRIDELESRVAELPTSSDVSNLDNRLKEVETRAGRTGDRLERLSGRIDELETQIQDLEQQQSTQTETTQTETTP